MKATSAQLAWTVVRKDLRAFIVQAFATLYPGKQFLYNWHIDAQLHLLEESMAGRAPRLIINLPPRSLKSFLFTVAFPAFLLGHDPSMKVMAVSYSDELAKNFSLDFKRLVESDWYRLIFPETKWVKMNESESRTDQGGYRLAVSVRGSLTGRGADLVIVDDPMKPDDAASDTLRTGINTWFRSTLLSRLDDKQFGAMIVVMQRLHVNDLTGFIEGPNYRKLALRAIATHDEVIPLRRGKVYYRKKGEALHEEREPLAVLESMRHEMSPQIFKTQYQQDPDEPDGSLFKKHYFKLVSELPPDIEKGAVFVSVDAATSTKDTADYTAISVVLALNGNFYVVASYRGRWDFEQARAEILKVLSTLKKTQWRVQLLIENAGTGISLISSMQRHPEARQLFDVLPYDVAHNKVEKAKRTLHYFFEGRVHILDSPGNTWVAPYLNEFLCFPNGKNDDQVDSLVQLLHWNGSHAMSTPKSIW